jgi:hypothetical protein
MRRFFAFAGILTLAACSGGGGGGTVPGSGTPTSNPPPAQYEKPSFTIKIPKREKIVARRPHFISSGTQSITITITATTNSGGLPSTTSVTSNINSTNCGGGCTVSGPPSPIGTDTFSLTTYDATNAGGNALDTNSLQIVVQQGKNNSGNVTLQGIPKKIVVAASPPPNFSAGTSNSTTIGGPTNSGITVSAEDADDEVITGTYANSVTVSDIDTNGDGTSLQVSTCPTYPTGNTPVSPTSLTFTSDTSAGTFCYGGLAENPVPLNATATGATLGRLYIQPTLSAPVYVSGSGTPSTVVVGDNPPDVQLIALTGTGSTGSATFTESGWTNAPYNQTLGAFANLACTQGSTFSDYATASANASGSNGTVVTVSVIGSPTPGECGLTISDGQTSNTTYGSAVLNSSYTSSSIGVNNKPHRR